MNTRSNTAAKRSIRFVLISLAAIVVFVVFGVAYTLKDSTMMTGGSCKILFADLNSQDPSVQRQARAYAENAVRTVKQLDRSAPIGEEVYSETIRDLSQFCDKHPNKNLLQLMKAYSGFED
jgi:hypothetical protein